VSAVWLLPLTLGAACIPPFTHDCADAGCPATAYLSVEIPDGRGAISPEGIQVDLCLNDECWSGVLPNNSLQLGQYPDAVFDINVSIDDGVLRFDVRFDSRRDVGQFRDGDFFSMRVVGADGHELAGRAWLAQYTTVDPNGPDCEPPPCRRAVLEPL
jgi:hypothetical protein